MKHLIIIAALASVQLIDLSGAVAWAQQDEQRQSELGARQRLVERKMQELENQFTSIAEKLQEKEPERAKRLIAAYQQAKEKLIIKKMAEVSRLLDESKFAEAEESIEVVIKRLDDLVRLLLNNQAEKQTTQEQIAQYEQWKKNLQDIKKDQSSQRRETEKVANKDSELKKLEAQIRQLDGLIKKQSDLIDRAAENTNSGLRELDKIADQQFEIRKKTENLKREVAGSEQESERAPNDSDESGATANSNKPNDQNSESQQQSGQQQSGQQQSGQQQSGQQQSGQQQSGQQQSGQQQSGQRQAPSNETPQPGEKPLEQAAKAQERAEENLGSGRPEDAKRQQQKALSEMQKARDELKKEQRRLASLPPEATQEMARKQRRTRDKALELLDKMAEAPKEAPSEEQQNGQQNQSSSQPGENSMQQAAQSMQKASQSLDDENTEEAEQEQRDAEQQIDKALDEIEERLNQLRDETREEKLKRLEGRFAEMLERQQNVSAVTIEVEDKKLNLGALQRRDQLVVLRLATDEVEIAELGQQAYDLLLEDGTSDVFPELVQELIDNLNSSAQLLQEERTDQLTQLLQQEIESTLIDLLEALAESKEKGNENGGGGGGGGGDQPLLKRSAELKMLRAAQLRLNRKTRQLDNIRSSKTQEDASLDLEIGKLSEIQSKLQEMAEKIMESDN
ncbi:MAG: hypothetical protein AAGA30_01095 [Planctomycetota bacterium]